MKFITIIFILLNLNLSSQQVLNWKFQHPISKEFYEFGEFGTIQEKLIEIEALPDPYYAENEKQFTWIEKYDWDLMSEFNLTESDLEKEFIEINFPSIDTYAKVYVNGKLVAETANAFHPHTIEIKEHATIGKNEIKITFISPINYHKSIFSRWKTKLPAPNDAGEIAVASMTRKPQYQFGWDWALRMNTIGLWKPAKILAYNGNKVVNVKIETISLEANQANLTLKVSLQHKKEDIYVLESKLFGTFSNIIAINGDINLDTQIKSPQLWWPRGHGEQYLYEDEISIKDEFGHLIGVKHVKFGIRTSELIQEQDQWGTSFYFKINGKSIFLKGANYIPQDAFPTRVKDEKVIELIEQMRISNFNTVRVWGGGYYQDEIFYKTCDEKGIMVWQDFMFACAMYPGDKDFLSLVEQELEYQIPRLAAHPSVIYFNGNNEVDVAWKNWGFQITYLIGARRQREMEEDYDNLFKKLAPELVKKHSNLPYEHTSPLSNWGKDEYFNHGTMHYWGVWHGKDPIEDFGLKTGRFNAEYGFQSFPELSTIATFSPETEWNLNSDIMKHHQKSYVGNGMIKRHADLLYGQSADFKEFVYFSQLTQAKAVGIAIAGHRADSPRCMGTLYWQLNDCWQAPTWSSIDYFGNWKALQYQVQKDFEDVAVVERTYKIGEERYFMISDVDESFTTNMKYKVFDLDGKEISSKEQKIDVDGNWLQELALETQETALKNKNHVIQFSWLNHRNEEKSRTFFHEAGKHQKATKVKVKIDLININEFTKTAKIKVETTAFLADFWIFSNNLGISFDKNFEHLLPGSYLFEIKFEETPKIDDFDALWR
jgi:beta-mannosidase